MSQHGYNPYIIPVEINGIATHAIRDTGNDSPTTVDPSLIANDGYTGNSVFLKGAFDGPKVKREIPLAIVRFVSSALNCCSDVCVEVGVCVKCHLGYIVMLAILCLESILSLLIYFVLGTVVEPKLTFGTWHAYITENCWHYFADTMPQMAGIDYQT